MAVANTQKLRNPFYVLLLLAGVAFAITACAYGVMTVKRLDAYSIAKSAGDSSFLDFVNEYGFQALMIELAVLAVTTFAAIGTDEYWMRRAAAKDEATAEPVETATEKDAEVDHNAGGQASGGHTADDDDAERQSDA